MAQKFQPLGELSTLEKFEPYIQPPWLANISCSILPRSKAVLTAQNLMGPAIFTDSSARNGLVGIEIYSPNMRSISISSTTMATTDTLNAFTGELLAIDMALAQLLFLARQIQARIHEDVTVFIDSQAALKAISGFTIQSGQFLTKNIIGKVQKLKENGIACRLQ